MVTFFKHDKTAKKMVVVPSFSDEVWVHAEDPTDDEKKFLVEELKLEQGHIEDALDQDEVPRFEVEGQTTYLFTRFLNVDDEMTTTLPLLLVVNKDVLVTVTRHNPGFINHLTQGESVLNPSQKEKIILYLLSQITKLYYSYFNSISKEIRQIRRKLERISNKNIVQLVGFEEILNDFRPSLIGTDNVLSKIQTVSSLKFSREDSEQLEDIHLSNRQLIDNCVDTLDTMRNIREAHTTILSNSLNNVIKLFTSLTVILTVPTIIASLYGMNVQLPLSDNPHAFFIVVLIIALSVIVSLYIFKIKDWL